MEDNAGKKYIFNNELKTSENPMFVDTAKIKTVYEVIRIIEGIPLFLEDHYTRMVSSMSAAGRTLEMSEETAATQIRRLVAENVLSNCNAKVTVYEDDGRQNVLMYISKSYYPSAEEYKNGVPTGLIQIERSSPNAKILNKAYKDTVAGKMREGGFFEVLLVNKEGFITEGSRSNAFFILENEIVTAPGEYILKGITRKYVLEACKNTGLEVVERLLGVSELKKIKGAFISGTSIKALPVAAIDERKLDVTENSPVVSVLKEYDKIVNLYLKEHGNWSEKKNTCHEQDECGKSNLLNDGCRKTKSRLAVFEILEKEEAPITAEEIFIKLKQQGLGTNLSTVYRTLEMLESKGTIEKAVITDGKARFQLSRGHRHHILCTACNKVIPIEGCPLEELEKSVCKDTSFDITGHKLELYGICPECKKVKKF